jgi:hypothetical protein
MAEPQSDDGAILQLGTRAEEQIVALPSWIAGRAANYLYMLSHKPLES